MWSPQGAGSLRWACEVVLVVAESAKKARLFARRRRANVEGGRRYFHKVGVSPEEEAVLLRLAETHGVSVPRLLVESAVALEQGETPTERKDAIVELFKLYRLLAAISNNVNQMAKAANATGVLDEDLRSTLQAVRRTAGRIDAAVDGLGAQ